MSTKIHIAVDALVFEFHHRGEVELRRADADAKVAKFVSCLFEQLRCVKEPFRWNAADVETRAAERFVFLDDRDFHPKLRGADRTAFLERVRTGARIGVEEFGLVVTMHAHAAGFHLRVQGLADLAVESADETIALFDDRHLDAQGRENASVFAADDAAADHQH